MHLEKIQNLIEELYIPKRKEVDLSDPAVYRKHSQLLVACGNYLLSHKQERFVVDGNNQEVLRFLLYYFNGSPLALNVFPDRKYSLNRNILLIGKTGVGKTLLMDTFRLYLQKTNNPRAYYVTSQTELLNYYKQHNHIDLYTYNTNEQQRFEGSPLPLCLNDIGLGTQRFFGNDTQQIVEEFLYARNEIWEQRGKATHITSNLDKEEFNTFFSDKHNRLTDRLKMFNVIPLGGESRR